MNGGPTDPEIAAETYGSDAAYRRDVGTLEFLGLLTGGLLAASYPATAAIVLGTAALAVPGARSIGHALNRCLDPTNETDRFGIAVERLCVALPNCGRR